MTNAERDHRWLLDRWPGYDGDLEAFAERVAIKMECGIAEEEARKQALSELSDFGNGC